MFNITATENRARTGVLYTPHGEIQTPCFMNVATAGAIKGAVSAHDMAEQLHTQVMLCNTYHLHVRPGDELVRNMGGLHNFTGWQGPILTDSGGFQVFSLAKLRNIKEEGVTFASHVNGARIFMGPEESMRIQHNLGSDIIMAFDECVANPAKHDYVQASCARTTRWLLRCINELTRIQAQRSDGAAPQVLMGINQGGTYEDLRIAHMQEIAALDLPGYAIGGLAVGEPKEEMYRIVATVEPHMPQHKPRYLMGVGTPGNLLEAVRLGIDMFDCVMPSRNARHGHLFTWQGVINLNNKKHAQDQQPIDLTCTCPTCTRYSRAYLRHLLKSGEMLAQRLLVMHNLHFYNTLMQHMREHIAQGIFEQFYAEYVDVLDKRV
ncbi:MAG: tRNA guanosine(34) transglycosylase Tgt [Oscillospiraceae bacterium]|nr:tRNA guanosine(34) transglycosylase Tgt [Oscillospiraceae bacterium]